MDLKELLGELFTPEIAAKIGDKVLAVVNDGSYIPKAKFDDKLDEIKTLKGQITDRDTQLTTLQAAATGNEALQKQITDLQAANTAATAEMQAKLDQQALDFAIDKALGVAKAKNTKLAKAGLDLTKIKLDGENLLGLSEQLEALKTSDAYLFDVNQAGGGANPPIVGGVTNNPYDKPTWNLTEQMKLETSNPTLAAQYQAAAGIK